MVAIKGKILSNNLWTTHARLKSLEQPAYGSIKLRINALAHNTTHCHHCDYYHPSYSQVVPILQLVYSTGNKLSLINKLKKDDLVEVECSKHYINKNNNFEFIDVEKNIKFYNLILWEKEVFLNGVPCRTISSCRLNPVSQYERNWKQSTRNFVSRLTKLESYLMSTEQPELTQLIQESLTQTALELV